MAQVFLEEITKMFLLLPYPRGDAWDRGTLRYGILDKIKKHFNNKRSSL